MIWTLIIYSVVGTLLSAGVVHAQPSGCVTNGDCEYGFYCEPSTFHCRECLSCEILNREPPTSLEDRGCTVSVSRCGPCKKGLVEDRGDVNFACVPPDERSEEAPYVWVPWVAVTVGLALLAVLVLVIVYLLRNTDTFKILASTRTSVRSPCSRDASAPELPPPYDATCPAPYNPAFVPPPARDAETPARDDDSSWPFIKRVPSEQGEEAGATAGREAAGHQSARMFNYPRYVRAPHLPANYKGPSSEESESTFTVHDEDTMESTWTPAPADSGHAHADHTDTNGNAVTSGPLVTLPSAAPHSPDASHAPHSPHDTLEPHALCSRQDTNNNRNPGEPGSGAGASGTPSVIINLVQNFTAVQQHNDVTL